MSPVRAWSCEEWYPVYSLHDPNDSGPHVEVTDEFADRYERAYREWTAMQNQIATLAVFHPTEDGGRYYPLKDGPS